MYSLFTSTSILTIASVVMACSLGTRAHAAAAHPIVHLDVAQSSAAFAKALRSGTIPPALQVVFLNDTELVVASIDGTGTPALAAVQGRLRDVQHLTLDFFSYQAGELRKSSQLSFDTDTANARITSMPSGKFLVSAGREISLYDLNRHLLGKTSADHLCGFTSRWPEDQIYDLHIFAVSETVGVINLIREQVDGRQTQITQNNICWFSIPDLNPEIRSFPKPTAFHATARDHTIFSTDSGATVEITPEQTRRLSLAAYCDEKERYDRSYLYLTHSDAAMLFQCQKGTLSVNRDGKTTSFKLPESKEFSQVLTDAWNAPIALLESARLRTRPIEGGFTQTRKLLLVNFDTGAARILEADKHSTSNQLYMGSASAFAISPDGHLVAVLLGSSLSVYRVSDIFKN